MDFGYTVYKEDRLAGTVTVLTPMGELNRMERERLDAELDAEYLPRGGWVGECLWMVKHAETDEDREFWLAELERARGW